MTLKTVSPTSGSNISGWSSAANIVSSNDACASTTTSGATLYGTMASAGIPAASIVSLFEIRLESFRRYTVDPIGSLTVYIDTGTGYCTGHGVGVGGSGTSGSCSSGGYVAYVTCGHSQKIDTAAKANATTNRIKVRASGFSGTTHYLDHVHYRITYTVPPNARISRSSRYTIYHPEFRNLGFETLNEDWFNFANNGTDPTEGGFRGDAFTKRTGNYGVRVLSGSNPYYPITWFQYVKIPQAWLQSISGYFKTSQTCEWVITYDDDTTDYVTIPYTAGVWALRTLNFSDLTFGKGDITRIGFRSLTQAGVTGAADDFAITLVSAFIVERFPSTVITDPFPGGFPDWVNPSNVVGDVTGTYSWTSVATSNPKSDYLTATAFVDFGHTVKDVESVEWLIEQEYAATALSGSGVLQVDDGTGWCAGHAITMTASKTIITGLCEHFSWTREKLDIAQVRFQITAATSSTGFAEQRVYRLRLKSRSAFNTYVSRSARYIVQLQGRVSRQARYSVIYESRTSRSTRYSVIFRDRVSRSARYSILYEGRVSRSVRYEAMLNARVSRSTRYIVQLQGRISRQARYSVEYTDRVSRSIRYIVQLQGRISRQARYSLEYNARISRSARYSVVREARISRSARYIVQLKSARVSRSVRYVVTSQGRVSRSLRYFIMVNARVSRSARYTTLHYGGRVSRSVRYTVFLNARVSRSTRYNLIFSARVSRSVRYSVFLQDKVSRQARYLLQLQGRVSRSATYRVGDNARISRSVRYILRFGGKPVRVKNFGATTENIIIEGPNVEGLAVVGPIVSAVAAKGPISELIDVYGSITHKVTVQFVPL